MFSRMTYHRHSGGWATVTVHGQSGAVVHKSKVRTSEQSLEALTEACKARGAAYVTWGAVRADLWVGTVHF